MKGWICSGIAARCNSGDLLPPSPPAEKTTARQDQAGQASIGDFGDFLAPPLGPCEFQSWEICGPPFGASPPPPFASLSPEFQMLEVLGYNPIRFRVLSPVRDFLA